MLQPYSIDTLDLALLAALDENPRVGDLELSRITQVARATVGSRIKRMVDAGIIASWSPRVDAAAAGFEVQAFVTLEIAQGALDEVANDLAQIPHVLEAYV
ncbi:MAG: Lrp/AsnC family transcriptional regulator, partial [Actinomycetes bacterium]